METPFHSKETQEPSNNEKQYYGGVKKIHQLYENLTYFSEYGFSVIVFVIITLFVLLGSLYCYSMINAQAIRDDWNNQRCNPKVIPFAGFINKPDNMTAQEYTAQNFQYCTQNILKGGASTALQPLTFATTVMTEVSNDISEAVQDARGMVNKVRTNIENVGKELFGRLMNSVIPLQQIIIAFNDVMAKITGVMTATLYTSLGTYYTLQASLGASAELIVNILIALATTIIAMWLVPVTWPIAATMSAIFIAISIPMALILAFMTEVMHITPGSQIPALPTCFDKDTMIEIEEDEEDEEDEGDEEGNPGNPGNHLGEPKVKKYKPISEIRVGEKLKGGNRVTSVLKLERNIKDPMYKLKGVIVSGTHSVFDEISFQWMKVKDHPQAMLIPLSMYNEPYVYCLNTSFKRFLICDMWFLDWDELDDLEYYEDLHYVISDHLELSDKKPNERDKLIHEYLDGGLEGDTLITMKSGDSKKIQDIQIGDVLEFGEVVKGTVKIDGSTISKHYDYLVNHEIVMKGGPNLIIYNSDDLTEIYSTLQLTEVDLESHPETAEVEYRGSPYQRSNEWIAKREIPANQRKKELYHLITDTQSFYVDQVKIRDYNSCVEFFL